MKANEFVKKFGWDESVCLIKRFPEWADGYCKLDDEFLNYSDAQDGYTLSDCEHCVEYRDLKHLVDSHELVESFGGINNAKRFYDENLKCDDSEVLRKAIADVESCQ